MIDMPAAGAARFTDDGFPAFLKMAEIGGTERILKNDRQYEASGVTEVAVAENAVPVNPPARPAAGAAGAAGAADTAVTGPGGNGCRPVKGQSRIVASTARRRDWLADEGAALAAGLASPLRPTMAHYGTGVAGASVTKDTPTRICRRVPSSDSLILCIPLGV